MLHIGKLSIILPQLLIFKCKKQIWMVHKSTGLYLINLKREHLTIIFIYKVWTSINVLLYFNFLLFDITLDIFSYIKVIRCWIYFKNRQRSFALCLINVKQCISTNVCLINPLKIKKLILLYKWNCFITCLWFYTEEL